MGWVLSGPVPLVEQSMNLMTTHTLRVDTHEESKLDDTLRAFWELESLGITGSERSVHQEFEESISFKNGRYEVSLPWKHPHPVLPDNYKLSRNRLQSVLRRLCQTPIILQEYDSIIRKQLELGIVQPIKDSDHGEVGNVHYLPHHAVIRQDKMTTKVRVVYDASAKTAGPSLNECLFTGPKFEQRILDILLRFCSYPIALTADIEKAFLMISVSEKGQNVLRFLWVDYIMKPDPDIQVFRFTRVVFGVSSSPFLLNATIDHHLKLFAPANPELVKTLRHSIYVDDVVAGARDESATMKLYEGSKRILQEGGFNLQKFITNAPQLQRAIERKENSLVDSTTVSSNDLDETYAKSTLGCTQTMSPTDQRVLGVKWDVEADHLIFSVREISAFADTQEPTKRKVTSIIGKFYDPLGFLSPVVINFKVFFQELCEESLDWDQVLTGSVLCRWQHLIASLQDAPTFSIPRYFLKGTDIQATSYHLHGFCDASKRAYAAVVYLVAQTGSELCVRFVASKTRVAPLRELSIPRLELMSALLLARLLDNITKSLSLNLSLDQPTCYTDSQVALYWIIGCAKEWKQFVQNRVSEIRRLIPVNCWQHCPGSNNPADLPSRGLTPCELFVSKLWHCGPDWLWEMTPKNPPEVTEMPFECLVEMKAEDKKTHALLSGSVTSINNVLRCEEYSSLSRLLSVTAYVLRFVQALKRAIENNRPPDSSSEVDAQELSTAEALWIQESQQELVKDKHFTTLTRQLGLFCDDKGIWRCAGRLHHANISLSAKHPILLPRNHHLTSLIVRKAHERVCHNGPKETLTEVRSRYWIIKGRSLVRKLIHHCTICKRYEGLHYQVPPPPPLPKFRVSEQPPFTYTGVDFAGPLYIRYPGSSETSKVWLCLFTCCVIRAVHLDVVPDMTTTAFLRCLKRFVARRGLPKRIVSDNGQTFKCAAKILQTMLNQRKVQQYLSGNNIQWTFNVERAPWWGGVFERMIKFTKRCLRKIIGQSKLYYDELITVLDEIEAVINSRPLTYLSPEDLDEPLTPSHFLCGRRILSLPDGLSQEELDEEFTVTPSDFSRRLKHLNATLNLFWKRWRREYLLELREAHRYHKGKPDAVPPSVGDIVLVEDEDKPRGLWKLARIISLIMGKDGHPRGAVLHVPSSGRTGMLQRPLQHLYPLEVTTQSPQQDPNTGEEQLVETDIEFENTQESEEPELLRPQRKAAAEARNRLAACSIIENDS